MIRLAWPVSSSRVTNVIPLAVPGRWRTSTIPATRTGPPLGNVFSSAAGTTPVRLKPSRKNSSGWAASDKPVVR